MAALPPLMNYDEVVVTLSTEDHRDDTVTPCTDEDENDDIKTTQESTMRPITCAFSCLSCLLCCVMHMLGFVSVIVLWTNWKDIGDMFDWKNIIATSLFVYLGTFGCYAISLCLLFKDCRLLPTKCH